MKMISTALLSSLGLGLVVVACSDPAASPGVGGATSSGGTAAGGGFAGTGGSSSGSGGVGAGTSGTGATPGSGGVAGTGNAPGGGGSAGVGGSPNGGSSGLGGSGGSGGGGAGTGGSMPVDEPSLITSGPGNYWQVGEVTPGGSSANVTVNPNQTYQQWHGFGGTFNEKGWWALSALNEADRQRAIRLLFDKNDGAGFTWGRIPIGASDYAYADNAANHRYTLNDNAGDLMMNNFSINRDRQRLIPYIKAAQAVKGDIRFWGSPWTPPPWMKTNNAYDRGLMKSDEQNLRAYAQYLVKWVQAYEAESIPIDHVQPQNEPGWSQDYPSCAWGPSSDNMNVEPFLGDFVENFLAPAIQTAQLDTKIWYGTLSNDGTYNAYWNNLSPAGRSLVEGVALQWGTVSHVGQIAQAGLLVMQSEHKCGNYPWLTPRATSAQDANRDNFLPSGAPNNHAYGEETWDLIKEWIEAGVNVYSAWNMVLDSEGFSMDTQRPWPQNALLTVNMNSATLTVTPAYYVFRHVAQYVEPGAVRVATQGGNALAFKNPDGSIVTVLFNSGQQAANTTLSVGGTMVQFTIPGRGWATVNWQG